MAKTTKKTSKKATSKVILNPVFGVVRKGTLEIKNLEDYPESIQEQLNAYAGQPMTDKATVTAFKELLTNLGLTMLDKDTAKAKLAAEKAAIVAAKKAAAAAAKAAKVWNPRTFRNITLENQEGDEVSSWSEISPKLKNHVGIYHLCIPVDAEGTQSGPFRLYEVVAMYENWNHTAVITEFYTHDTDTIRPEQVRARRIWEMDENGVYTDEQEKNTTHLLIPVRRIPNVKEEPKPEIKPEEPKAEEPKAEQKAKTRGLKPDNLKPRKPKAKKDKKDKPSK